MEGRIMYRIAPEKGISDKVYNLVKIRAYSFHCTTGITYNELISEGLYIYSRALLSYNPDKGVKFTTYLYGCLNRELIQFCTKWRRQLPALPMSDILEHLKHENPGKKHYDLLELRIPAGYDQEYEYKEMLSKLSPEAQGIALLLEECADEIVKEHGDAVKDPHSVKHLRGSLARYLRKLGWKHCNINRAFGELRKVAIAI
jgi:Sigma-70 region 2